MVFGTKRLISIRGYRGWGGIVIILVVVALRWWALAINVRLGGAAGDVDTLGGGTLAINVRTVWSWSWS